MKNADLHTHTFYSVDSDISPEDLVRKAKKVGLKYVAITDHDCVSGIERALKAGKKMGIEVIPGVELHSEFGEVLGFFIDHRNRSLMDACEKNEKIVDERALKIIQLLRKDEYDVDAGEIRQRYKTKLIERPHIAYELVRKGYARSFRDAFDRFIAKGNKYYAEANLPPTLEIVKTIRQAKGLPVLAHPYYENYKEQFKSMKSLIEAGLCGVELPEKSRLRKEHWSIHGKIKSMAEKYGLIVTSGSDFHGSVHPYNVLGGYNCEESVVLALKNLRNLH